MSTEKKAKGCATRLVVLLLVGLCCPWSTRGQTGVGVYSIEDIKTRLMGGSDSDRAALANELHMFIPSWTRGGGAGLLPCTLFSSVESQTLGDRQTIVISYSQNCSYTYLVVFEQATKGNLRYIDTTPLWSKFGEPKISLENLVDDTAKDVVVSNFTVDEGTGINQTDLVIFKYLRGGLQVVFEAAESSRYAVEPDHGQRQQSTFSFIVPSRDTARTSRRQVLEKRVIQERATKLTQWWLYIWVPELRRFQGIRTYDPTALP